MRLGVVILAAGASSRMGQPKLLLPWGNSTILAHLIGQWGAVGAVQIVTVIEANSPLTEELDRFRAVERIVNSKPTLGMFSSVQCAARWDGWNKAPTHFAITLGDQPQVRIETLKTVVSFAEQHPDAICQPARRGRGRHPVIMPRKHFLGLATAKESTLKEFLQAREGARKLLESDDGGLDSDLDTIADYEKAIHQYTSRK